jgi:hypothetical protein
MMAQSEVLSVEGSLFKTVDKPILIEIQDKDKVVLLEKS